MHRPFHIRTLTAGALAVGAALALVPPADGGVPGRNGRIAFTSGREAATDNEARLFLTGPVGLPGTSPLALTPLGGQSRHPSWSPDRTKLVYANGTFTGDLKTEEYDLFVKDFVADTITPLDGTQLGDGLSSDHPAWSPDGTRIAYEHHVDGSANREIKVKTVGTVQPAVNLTATNQTELKPAWSPDGQTLYYAKQNGAGSASNFDIVRQPAAGGAESPVAAATGVDEYQPAISPDGTRLCFTLQSPGNPASADIYTAQLPGLAPLVDVSDDPSKGDINCTWSPDGRKIAFTNGVFGQGRLVVVDADDSSPFPLTVAQDDGANNFDGNADWAPDGSPDCPDRSVSTAPDTPLVVGLECADTGPAYERTDPNGTVVGSPEHGTTKDDSPLTNPSTVTYVPKPGFTGTDTFRYTAFDDFGFGTDEGTVTVRVEAPAPGGGPGPGPGGPGPGGPGPGGPGAGPGQSGGGGGKPSPPRPTCDGRVATIVGTPGRDRIAGTKRRDVIVALGGDDVIRAGGGGDRICAGPGRDSVRGDAGDDRLFGGTGADRLTGGTGRDRLSGGAGRDLCAGGPGRDRALGCERPAAR